MLPRNAGACKNAFDYLRGGHSLAEFLDDFPSVKREQATEAIAATGHRLVETHELVQGGSDAFSFASERRHGIDFRRAASRQPASEQSHSSEQQSDSGQRNRILGTDAKKQVGQHACQGKRTQKPKGHTHDGQSHPLAYDQVEH